VQFTIPKCNKTSVQKFVRLEKHSCYNTRSHHHVSVCPLCTCRHWQSSTAGVADQQADTHTHVSTANHTPGPIQYCWCGRPTGRHTHIRQHCQSHTRSNPVLLVWPTSRQTHTHVSTANHTRSNPVLLVWPTNRQQTHTHVSTANHTRSNPVLLVWPTNRQQTHTHTSALPITPGPIQYCWCGRPTGGRHTHTHVSTANHTRSNPVLLVWPTNRQTHTHTRQHCQSHQVQSSTAGVADQQADTHTRQHCQSHKVQSMIQSSSTFNGLLCLAL